MVTAVIVWGSALIGAAWGLNLDRRRQTADGVRAASWSLTRWRQD